MNALRHLAIAVCLVSAVWLQGHAAAAQEPPVVLTAEGPASACAGQDIAFTFSYRIDPARVDGLSFVIPEPANAQFVSLERVGDTTGAIGHSVADPRVPELHTFTPTSYPSGAVRLTVRTDSPFRGTIRAGSLISGTGTVASNTVLTTVAPCPYPVVLTAEGPASACAGEGIAFTFGYRVDMTRADGTGFVMWQPSNASFVSLEPVGDTTGTFGHSNADPRLAESHLFEPTSYPSGAVRLTVRTQPTFSGVVDAGSWIPGTGTTQSNHALTTVAPCASALPGTGLGRESAAPLRAAWTLLLLGLATTVIGLGAMVRTNGPPPRR
jgi:hypothetical protein